jgi:hypothetical protein
VDRIMPNSVTLSKVSGLYRRHPLYTYHLRLMTSSLRDESLASHEQ